MNIIFTAALSLLICFNAAIAQDTVKTPYELVADASEHIVLTLKDPQKNTHKDIREALDEALVPVVDFDGIAKAVMGKYSQTATQEQRVRFTNTLKNTMLELYTKVLSGFAINRVNVDQPPADQPFKGRVNMAVTAGDGTVYNITYSMRQAADGHWKIRNVILDGINLGLTYRTQFYSAANSYNGNIDLVINSWGQGNVAANASNSQK